MPASRFLAKRARSSIRHAVDSLESRRLLSITLAGDLNPTPSGIAPYEAPVALPDGRLIYAAQVGVIQRLLVTDGTASQTRELLRVSDDSRETADPDVVFLGLTHGKLLFSLNFQGIAQLWSTDGTVAGTRQLYTGELSSRIGTIGGDAIIRANVTSASFLRTDGTVAGTSYVELANSITSYWSRGPVVLNDRAYFISTDGALWSNSGATAGSRRVATLLNVTLDSDDPPSLYPIDERRFAISVRTAAGEAGLWISDGTTAGTKKLVDQSGTSSQLVWIRPLGERIVFALTAFDDFEPDPDSPWTGLFTADGTPGGTRRILPGVLFKTSDDSSPGVVTSGGRLFAATTDGRIIRTDGTAAGTSVAATLRDVSALRTVGSEIYFSTSNAWQDGAEVMRLGTHGPYAMPVEPRGTGGSAVSSWASLNGTAYYLSPLEATLDSTNFEMGLFRLRPGTTRAEQIPFVASDARGPLVLATSSWALPMSVVGGKLVLRAKHAGASDELPVTFDPATGQFNVLPNFDTRTAGWATQSAVLLPDGGAFFMSQYGGKMALLASPGSEPVSLLADNWSNQAWPLDGSRALLSSDPYRSLNGSSYRQLYVSDGSVSGTKNIAFHANGVYDFEFAFSDGRYAYYRATDLATEVRGLWRTDGTRAGTVRLRDDLQAAHTALTVAGVTYFCGAPVERDPETGSYDAELWRTDGTPAGTRRAVDLVPGAQGSYPDQFHFDGKHIYFTANLDDYRKAIFRTDGTPAGTERVAVLPLGRNIDQIAYLDGVAYLRVGNSLYRCDLQRGWLTNDPSFREVRDLSSVNGRAIVIGYRNDDGLTSVTAVDLAGRSTRLADDVGYWLYDMSVATLRDSAGVEHMVGASSDALFVTDGTPGGTRELVDLSPDGAIDPPWASSRWFTSGTQAYIAMNTNRFGYGEVFTLQSPEARIAPGAVVAERGTVQLSAAPSTDPDPYETLTYTWDLDGDGVFGEVGIAAGRGDEVGATPTFRAVGVRGMAERIRLRVENSAGLASIATGSVRVTPLVPASLAAIRRTDGAVQLRWADRSSIEGGFSVERSADGITWARIGGTFPNVTTFLDARAAKGQRVAYRVLAVQGSAPSSVVWVD